MPFQKIPYTHFESIKYKNNLNISNIFIECRFAMKENNCLPKT